MAGRTLAEIRSEVLSITGAYLGEYAPGKPAIWVGPESHPTFRTEGVEAVVLPTPDFRPEAHQGGGGRLERVWEIRFKGWTDGTPTGLVTSLDNLRAAVEAFLKVHPDADTTTLPPNERAGILAEVSVRIPEHVPL